MHCTSTAVDFVENMAQEQIRYETIFGEQAEALRADLPRFEGAMAQIQQSPLVAKRGQRWDSEPTQDNVDEYLAHSCDDICRLVPHDFEELGLLKSSSDFSLPSDTFSRVKILHAAHAALMCLVTCKTARQHGRVQLVILKYSGIYEVIGCSVNRDKTVKYDMLFDDCEDPVTVTAREMMGMLEDSLYLPD